MSVTAARGFRAAGVASGIKASGELDLALVSGPHGTVGAAVFTRNRAAAAPVLLSRAHVARGPSLRAAVINSGCANAATGAAGQAAAQEMADCAARELECAPDEVLVASTGTIGSRLPVIRVTSGIAAAAQRLATGALADRAAAMAIMTTDTVPKMASREVDGFVVGGMAKGAGMVRPDMATMLVVITTDALVDPGDLDRALRTSVDESFHGLNIDGCPSTNDMVCVLASGASAVEPGPGRLTEILTDVARDLARQLAADAEGASRIVTLEVEGAVDNATARAAGRAIADSALVRTAFYGGDPNWGRLVGALGATSIAFDPADIAIDFAGTKVAAAGVAVPFDEDALAAELAEGDFTVRIAIGDGPGRAEVLTTDLTTDYVTFNAERS